MPAPTYNVVVAEDERLLRDSLVEKIGHCDPSFIVIGAAADGAGALGIIEARHVDVLFTDIRMPVMDGLALAQAVQARRPDVQVVIVSGYADFAYAQQAIRLGVEEYMLKPVKLEALAEVLRQLKARLDQVAGRSLETLRREVPREAGGSQELVESIRDFIRANFNTDITLDEIARRFNFTPSYLDKLFRKHAGETPIQYLINLRMAEARRLMIAYPDMDIKQVGEVVGYADPHYFSRIFKNVNGMTPTEYRNRSRGG